MNNELMNIIRDKFTSHFSSSPDIMAQAPGRINIIGEHTDYNGGFVLPAGVNRNIYAAVSRRNDKKVFLYSYDLNETAECSLTELFPTQNNFWANYVKGVLNELILTGQNISGINIVFGGDIPIGAGLSSSAALETVTAVAVNHIYNLNLKDWQIIHACWNAENNFVGMKCGVMDQFTSFMSKKDSILLLDCKSLEFAVIPFIQKNFRVVICNSNKKRELADSEYNKRRMECEEGVKFFNKLDRSITYLRDVETQMFENHKHELDRIVAKRCEHVIQENIRVRKCVDAFENQEIDTAGELINASHDSLRDLFEVSCPELDILAEIAMKIKGCRGSRMMGAGFGGCTLNLVNREEVENFCHEITEEYINKTGIRPEIYVCEVEEGAGIL